MEAKIKIEIIVNAIKTLTKAWNDNSLGI